MSDVLLMLMFISSVVTVIVSTDCYQCTYNSWAEDQNLCLDPFRPGPGEVTQATCDGMCTKSIFTRNGDITFMARSCIPYADTTDICIHGCFELVRDDARRSCVWCCDDLDFCNSADSVTFSHLLCACVLLACLVTWLAG
ncbi:uncharacterized protein LOC119725640 [Patiria miniata]|uniref:Uncharacterized protein n=1 Tax=Patiria miniata TaxID=46514 RepID=A0A913ZMS6_PATMI|nr:uncharacterized protein LOC119725640 [Patiria miniata]